MAREKIIKLMDFNKLSQESQNRIISEVITTIIDTTEFDQLHKNSKLYKAYRDCAKMKTPWFLGEYIWEYCKSMVLKECRRWLYSEDATIMEAK